ncbi:hypothetical protein [Jiangella sp. DSM 45060]|uniref:hypothetical protein n=1 Tax=Jiangella sp. DSM 45060 TaxID=1798224 RepID=UPI00087C1C6B|nr:hypothetical protein [Jiangella sp. DSM 45060]SDT43549.1 hypothetical protein SAMN04515669_4045 [Jiangella sp. DSM 45060]
MTRSTRRGSRLLPVVALVLTVALTACGSDDGGDDDVSAAGTGGGGSTSDGGGGSGGVTDPEQAELDFYACMRENGVDMPDPDPGQPGVQLQLPPGSEAAMEECRSLLPNGGEMQETSPDDLESLRAFTECMRENGVDMPDPAADGRLTMPAGVDPQSAEFQAAMTTCQPELDGAPIRIGPGGGR